LSFKVKLSLPKIIGISTKAFYRSLKKVPVPDGLNSREIVKKAINFDDPPRIPYLFFYHPTAGDIFDFASLGEGIASKPSREGGSTYVDEWGVTWKVTGKFWDTAIEPFPLADLKNLPDYKFPRIIPKGMARGVKFLSGMAKRRGKYVVAPDLLNFYEVMRSIMGFEQLLLAPYTQPDGLHALLERLTAKTIEIINMYGNTGNFDAFMTWQDWGLQERLQMRIDTFKEFYKPYYKRIIDTTHDLGMDFIWHNCGHIVDMIPEMIDLGVDVVQLDQPKLMGYENLVKLADNKLCMWNCLDIQWVTQPNAVSNEDIKTEIEEMIRIYGKRKGGLIIRNYPQPWDINLSVDRQKFINRTFNDRIYK